MPAGHSRRRLFLLAALALPSAVLLLIALRLVAQERELGARRQVEARALAVAQLGRELSVELERLRLRAAAVAQRGDYAEAAQGLVMAVVLRNGSFQLPWPRASPTAAQHHLAALRQAALHSRAGRVRDATMLYDKLARLPLTQLDDEGMPIAFYAAEWLAGRGHSIPQHILDADYAPLHPIALHALNDLLRRSSQSAAGEARVRAAHQLRHTEQLLALERELPVLQATAARALTATQKTIWLPYGEEPWLVGFARGDSMVVVGDAAHVMTQTSTPAARGAQLFTAAAPAAEPLGPTLPGLYARVTPDVISAAVVPLRGRFLLLALIFAGGVTGFTVYLALRDVRREVRATELRSQFVASVSHELKTPLTSIRMYAEMLRMEADQEAAERTEFLDTIVNESERLSRLINNVLDFSRIERGEQAYRRTPVQLNAVVQGVARAMEYTFRQSGLKLTVYVDPDLPALPADRDAIEQALLNLLSNAIKYSRADGEQAVDLRAERVNGSACIRVRDHGRGIPAAEQLRVFEKFYRSPEVERAGIPGTGLGLALVAHVACGHQGAVEVDSEPGVGSTFSMRLPLEPS